MKSLITKLKKIALPLALVGTLVVGTGKADAQENYFQKETRVYSQLEAISEYLVKQGKIPHDYKSQVDKTRGQFYDNDENKILSIGDKVYLDTDSISFEWRFNEKGAYLEGLDYIPFAALISLSSENKVEMSRTEINQILIEMKKEHEQKKKEKLKSAIEKLNEFYGIIQRK